MRAILKELRRKHTAKMRVAEISFGLVLCILASIAMTSVVSRVSKTIAIPYVSSSDKHKVAVKSEQTSVTNDADAPDQAPSSTSSSTLSVSTAPDPSTVNSTPAPSSKPLVSASISTPLLQVDPVQVDNPLPKANLLCKIPVSVTLPILRINTCE